MDYLRAHGTVVDDVDDERIPSHWRCICRLQADQADQADAPT